MFCRATDRPPNRTWGAVLSVDDEPAALALRQEILKQAGFGVLSAATASEALALLQANHIDLVLLEPILAGAECTELIERMKELKPDVPVVLYSAALSIPEGAGSADEFITKLAPVDELMNTIHDLISKRRAIVRHFGPVLSGPNPTRSNAIRVSHNLWRHGLRGCFSG